MRTTVTANVYGAQLSRRQFVKTGGALVVSLGIAGQDVLTAAQQRAAGSPPDPSRASSWFEIHADNTMTVRTGKSDFGQSSTTTAYKQIVAEELYFPIESITTVAWATLIERLTVDSLPPSWAWAP